MQLQRRPRSARLWRQAKLQCCTSVILSFCCRSCFLDCSPACQQIAWTQGGHRQACKAAAFVPDNARLGLPPQITMVGYEEQPARRRG